MVQSSQIHRHKPADCNPATAPTYARFGLCDRERLQYLSLLKDHTADIGERFDYNSLVATPSSPDEIPAALTSNEFWQLFGRREHARLDFKRGVSSGVLDQSSNGDD